MHHLHMHSSSPLTRSEGQVTLTSSSMMAQERVLSLLIDDALDDGLARTYKDIDEETDLTRKKKEER